MQGRSSNISELACKNKGTSFAAGDKCGCRIFRDHTRGKQSENRPDTLAAREHCFLHGFFQIPRASRSAPWHSIAKFCVYGVGERCCGDLEDGPH